MYLEKAETLKRQIKGALMYPVITVLVAGVVVAVLLLFVVPSFEEMFADMGAGLLALTQMVIDMSKWMQADQDCWVSIFGTVWYTNLLQDREGECDSGWNYVGSSHFW